MYREFVGYLRKMEIGEFRISLQNQGEIERKLKDGKELSRMQPRNYKGSLNQVIAEINEKLDSGYVVNPKSYKKMLNKFKSGVSMMS